MRCPRCSACDDHVVDSREVDRGESIRRRRECRHCGHRYTTFERIGGAVTFVVKRSAEREPFRREKIVAGVRAACKNRPVDDDQIDALALAVETELARGGRDVTTVQIGVAVLDRLRELDDVAYIRFASVYKGFESPGDFEREAGLLTKVTSPKQHGAAESASVARAGQRTPG
ncbi:MAG: transcriptional regulator NrdR [Acidimicrobiales bacterium]